jgi:nucleotide-binding universal stress UspA family protein
MIQTIAVGTDGSATAARALDEALDMAQRFDARLIVLSAYDSRAAYRATTAAAMTGMSIPVDAEWERHSKERVDSILADARASAGRRGVQCDTDAADGDAAEVLVTLAADHRADILVVGNKGMKRRVLGSVPNTVAHKAPCSVFVVKTT